MGKRILFLPSPNGGDTCVGTHVHTHWVLPSPRSKIYEFSNFYNPVPIATITQSFEGHTGSIFWLETTTFFDNREKTKDKSK